MKSSIEEWFRTTVGGRQGCLFSLTLFNIFLGRIISDALEEQYDMVNIGGRAKVNLGGRTIINLRFADDTDVIAEEWRE